MGTNLEMELHASPADNLSVCLVSKELQNELPEVGTVASFRHFTPSVENHRLDQRE